MLIELLEGLPEAGDLRIGKIVYQLRRRSFGGIFLLLAALAVLPGISFFAGLALVVPGVQLVLGFRAPLLPRFIRRRRVRVSAIRTLGRWTIPWLEKLERYVKPRWLTLTDPPLPRIIGLVVLVMALTIMLPLPLSNFMPAFALVCFAFAIFERDGLMTFIGFLLAGIAFVFGATLVYLALEVLILLAEQLD
ncbi:MAG: exopolysaccharide biosynthesis protein [Pseudomonadota bacterium]